MSLKPNDSVSAPFVHDRLADAKMLGFPTFQRQFGRVNNKASRTWNRRETHERQVFVIHDSKHIQR